MIKVGQIYKNIQGKIFVISYIGVYTITLVYEDGYVEMCESVNWIEKECKCLAKYSTFKEAVNSKEFRAGAK